MSARPAVKVSTKDKILNAAEALFAEHGFEQTSLRQITAEADVNLASVNYHFGSKKALIQAVIARYASVFMPALEAKLTPFEQQTTISSLAIFNCFREPLSRLNEVRKHGAAIYLSLLGYAYAEIQGHLRKFMLHEYGAVVLKLVTLLHRANPQLSDEEIFWRLHFVLGSTVFSQVSSQALQEIAAADFHSQVSAEDIIEKLIPFIAGGMDAPAAS